MAAFVCPAPGRREPRSLRDSGVSRFTSSTLTAHWWTPRMISAEPSRPFSPNTPRPDVEHSFLKRYIGYHLIDCSTISFRRCRTKRSTIWFASTGLSIRPAATSRRRCIRRSRNHLERFPAASRPRPQRELRPPGIVLEQFGLLPYFDHVQGTDGFPCKPNPDVILKIA